jgi:6-phosphogluconolactonase (cycloisomerase 2 family)
MGDDLLYLGSLGADPREAGITAVRRDGRTGDLSVLGLVAPATSPSFLARDPTRPVLYATGEAPGGEVRAWRIAGDGGLAPLGTAATGGDYPCHLAVHPSGRYLLSANYGSGSVAVHRLDGTGAPTERTELVAHHGTGPDQERQEGPHAHLVAVDPDGRRAHVVDLGADAVFHYRFDVDSGRLDPVGQTRTRPGTGPRHLARYGDLRYLVGELDGTLACYQVAGDGAWRERERLPICADGAEGYASEVAVSADGRFVYVATRGPDRLAVFGTDTGRLRPAAEVPCGGHWPRHFALVGEHLYVANERSGTVVTFRVDPDTGVPAPTGNQLPAPAPSCVLA